MQWIIYRHIIENNELFSFYTFSRLQLFRVKHEDQWKNGDSDRGKSWSKSKGKCDFKTKSYILSIRLAIVATRQMNMTSVNYYNSRKYFK